MEKYVISYSFKQEKVFDNQRDAKKFADERVKDEKNYENVVFHTLKEPT